MTPLIRDITLPLRKLLPHGEAVLLLVTHPLDRPPEEILTGVEQELTKSGLTFIRNNLDWFSPDLVQFMRTHPAKVFSVLCSPKSVEGEHPAILNFRRSPWLSLKKGLILWIADEAMPRLSDHASNFLDFYHASFNLDSGEKAPPRPQLESSAQNPVDISRLPYCGTPLIGRKKHLEQLDHHLTYPDYAVVALTAPGGVGKSALIEAWLNLLHPHFFGSRKVFGWSFYSQGGQGAQSNSTFFFHHALIWFGHQGEIPISMEEKAAALARLLQKEKTILVLDGVEPLQHDPTSLEGGRFTDPGLHRLLRILSREGQRGLTIVTSRKPLLGMAEKFLAIPLELLTEDEGSELLNSLGVTGDALQATIKTLQGHALSLNLLGRFLTKLHEGRIEEQSRIASFFEPIQAIGDQARRIMAHYDEEIWQGDAPEKLFLRMLGLFDRPMEADQLEALKKGVAKPLTRLTPLEFNRMIETLQEAGLLLPSLGKRKQWDAHPLVREWFGQRLRTQDKKKFREAHQILFEYFQLLPEKHQPDTLEELEPLYRAIHHGYQAEMHQDARNVLKDRLWRVDKELDKGI
ncbi:MAG: hypothetical protein HQL94_00510 [Magnetococcales bacterium]|nr:hypothetical protein [Magnetococcales bacterium]MBF0437932.1 hypothetical protein [Magnetococcales bacterium]